MSESSDRIDDIQALADARRHTESELRSALEAVGQRLADACVGIEVSAWSTDCTFSECPPNDEWTRGHFDFGSGGIGVFYQSHNDVLDAWFDRDPFGPQYHGISIKECPIGWIRALLDNHCLQDLMSKIRKCISDETESLRVQRDGMRDLAEIPSLAVSSAFEKAAQGLGYSRALDDWRKAQTAVAATPESAITLACTLLETVAKHVLSDLRASLPADKSVGPLFKAAAKALGLAPEDQANADLKGLCGAIGTIAKQVGALRTHFGDAHGKGPDDMGLSTSEARLAVNTAGSAATFLMERWLAKKDATSG